MSSNLKIRCHQCQKTSDISEHCIHCGYRFQFIARSPPKKQEGHSPNKENIYTSPKKYLKKHHSPSTTANLSTFHTPLSERSQKKFAPNPYLQETKRDIERSLLGQTPIRESHDQAEEADEEEGEDLLDIQVMPHDTPVHPRSLREEFMETKQMLHKSPRINTLVGSIEEEEEEEGEDDGYQEAYEQMIESHYAQHRDRAYFQYPLDSIHRLSKFDSRNAINPELFESLNNRKTQHVKLQKRRKRVKKLKSRLRRCSKMASTISIGDRCEISLKNTKARGVVRFVGPTEFSKGEWIGVELDHPVGKNDGSVKGVPYFECIPLHGVLVRPDRVHVGNFPRRLDEAPSYVLRESLDPHHGRSSLRTNSPWIPRKKSGFVPNPYFLPKNKRPKKYRNPDLHATLYRESITDSRNIFIKLTDHKLYTGTHKHRFNPDGSGRGIDGRHSIVKGQGTIYDW